MTASISVLLPLRGAAPFLGQALASLQAQASGDWRGVLCPVGEALTVLAARAAATDPRFCAGPTGASEAAALARWSRTASTRNSCACWIPTMRWRRRRWPPCMPLAARPDAGMAYSRHVLVDTDGRVLGPAASLIFSTLTNTAPPQSKYFFYKETGTTKSTINSAVRKMEQAGYLYLKTRNREEHLRFSHGKRRGTHEKYRPSPDRHRKCDF